MAGCSGFAGLGFNACGRVAVVAFSLFACQGAVAADAPLDPFSVTQAVRLAKMRADVATAKLKVGYPGKCYEPTEEEMKWKLDEFTPKARRVAAVLDYYDVGEETIGYVEAKGKSCPKLYVGESVSEMRSTDKSGFEQTTEMREVSPGVWRSVVPLALRYFRFVGAVEEERFLEDVDSSLVLKGAFSSMDPKVDSIWRAAARTVFLCSRHFIVDGVKRDRLPWAGDLSVSLLANAYTYADAETVKRTIAALETFRPETSDVNGLIDYSLWLVISHDLFQLYFGDMDFLRVQYPSIRSRLEVFARRADKDGLLRNDGFGGDGLGGSGGKIFVDWTPEIRDNVGDGGKMLAPGDVLLPGKLYKLAYAVRGYGACKEVGHYAHNAVERVRKPCALLKEERHRAKGDLMPPHEEQAVAEGGVLHDEPQHGHEHVRLDNEQVVFKADGLELLLPGAQLFAVTAHYSEGLDGIEVIEGLHLKAHHLAAGFLHLFGVLALLAEEIPAHQKQYRGACKGQQRHHLAVIPYRNEGDDEIIDRDYDRRQPAYRVPADGVYVVIEAVEQIAARKLTDRLPINVDYLVEDIGLDIVVDVDADLC